MVVTAAAARHVGTSTPQTYSSTSVTVGVKAASICVKVIVRYMYAALVAAKVSPCAAPIGTMLVHLPKMGGGT